MRVCGLRKLCPLLASAVALATLALNITLFQLGLQSTQEREGLSNSQSHHDQPTTLGTPDPMFVAAVVNDLPEISERTLLETFQLENFKIYVYELPSAFNSAQLKINAANPPRIRDPNCTANFYSAEYSLHQFLLRSTFRTLDPWKADLFYVPAYSCCYLINNHPNNLTKTAIFHHKLLSHIRTAHPYFNLSDGRDHVWAFTQGFGAKMFGDWHKINNGIFLVHNGQYTLEEFTPHKDITIPPDLTGYNFSSYFELPASTRPQKKWLAHFGGTVLPITLTDERGSHYSKGVRQYIKEHFTEDPKFRITGTRVDTYIEDMMSSVFCLCPEGWHAWNPRPYQAVQLGCIPVLISEEIELAFEEIIDYSRFMVRIRPSDMAEIKSILEAIPEREVQAMRREMERVWRLFSYGRRGLAPQMIVRTLALRKSANHIRRTYATPAKH